VDRLLAAAALPVDGHAGDRLRQAGRERRPAGGVAALLADLPDRAADHVVHDGRIDPGPLDERPDRVSVQVHRMHAGQRTARLTFADGCAHRVDDDCVSHVTASLMVSSSG
jgi:hypothetical protein